MLAVRIAIGRPTSEGTAAVKTSGFIAKTCNNTNNNVKDT
jgi:hypothetical protein